MAYNKSFRHIHINLYEYTIHKIFFLNIAKHLGKIIKDQDYTHLMSFRHVLLITTAGRDRQTELIER